MPASRPAPETPVARTRRGHGRVTLAQVAAAAGVTAITVSRFLREPERVAPETAGRIRDALAASGYVPNKQAGLLASGRSNVVAALLPNLANSIFAETAQGLADGLQAAGFELMIAATGYSAEREEQQLRAVLGWHPAAVVVTGRLHTDAARALLAQAQAAGTPVLEVWDRRPGGRFAQIGFDHREVGAAMAQHLLDGGARRLAYVDSGVAADHRAHERGIAFAERARAAGASVRVVVAPEGDAFDAGRAALRLLLDADGGTAVDAAAFANDPLACGALLEARRLGVAVPQRLGLLGFGDFTIGRQLEPALSTVRLPRLEIGAEAARTLLAALRNGGTAASRTLPWTLLPRQSTLHDATSTAG